MHGEESPAETALRDDEERLRTLCVLHHVHAAILAIGACFGRLMMGFGDYVAAVPTETVRDRRALESLAGTSRVAGTVLMATAAVGAALTFASALGLGARRLRPLSVFVAALECFAVPLGTALGAWTMSVLARPAVRRLYERAGEGVTSSPS